MIKRIIRISLLAVCAIAVIYLLFGGTLRRWLTPPDTVIARVGGEAVTLKDLNCLLVCEAIDIVAYPNDHKDFIIRSYYDVLIKLQVCLGKARELGFYPLTDKLQAKAIMQAETVYKGNRALFEKYGITLDDAKRMHTSFIVYRLMRDEFMKPVVPTEEQLKSYYDEQLANQIQRVNENTRSYDLLYARKEYADAEVLLYRPEGYRLVRQVLIPFPNEVKQEIYNAWEESAKLYRERLNDACAQIKDKAEQVLQKAREGYDFSALNAGNTPYNGPRIHYSGDQSYDTYMRTEYEVGPGTALSGGFTEAALALENVGDVSGLVVSDYGYHVIQYLGELPAGPVPFEEVKEIIRERYNKITRTPNGWHDEQEQWKKEAEVKIYPERIPY